jgi:hypothetical protein
MHFGDSIGPTVSLVISAAYNVVVLIWIGYLRQQPHRIPAVEMTPRLEVALADPATGGEFFISMVERAVEEVLSRNPWPGTHESEISTREPGSQKNKSA